MANRILAVDDEDYIRDLVQINLEKAGYEVLTATNGREACEVALAQQPDLIVMDVMMPEVDGITALQTLKDNPMTSEIPVILLTAKDQNADVFQGWKNGADLYLTKPFQIRELLVFVRRILEASHEAEEGDKRYEVTQNTLPE